MIPNNTKSGIISIIRFSGEKKHSTFSAASQEYVFNVGDKITSETPPLGYRALYRLIFGSVTAPVIHPPDIVPVGGNGGFDATVDDWENVEVDILL